jgi:hypothetical protein
MRTGYANRRLRIRMHGSIHDPTAGVKQEVVACQNRCRRVSLVTTLPKDLPWSIYIRVYKHTHTHIYLPCLVDFFGYFLITLTWLAGISNLSPLLLCLVYMHTCVYTRGRVIVLY